MIYCKFIFFFQYSMHYNVLSLATLMIHSDACHYHPRPFLKDVDLRKSRIHSVSPFFTLVHRRTSKKFENLSTIIIFE